MRFHAALLLVVVIIPIDIAIGWVGNSPYRTRMQLLMLPASNEPDQVLRKKISVSFPHSLQSSSRRDLLLSSAFTMMFWNFVGTEQAVAYTPDSDKLRESLYLMSRVQEATVQIERLIRNTDKQEDLKGKLKLKLKLVQASYRLSDQINYASQFVNPQDEIVAATEAGNIAVSSLEDAVVYARDNLSAGPITNEQREFLNEAMSETRDNLFTFLTYMPSEKLQEARKRVELENGDNREEFGGDPNAPVYNPVELPWK